LKRERITQVLERKIESRPDRDDLLEKNILKGTHAAAVVAPSGLTESLAHANLVDQCAY